ncbi:hypothetical protein ACN6MY_08985 [Peribacillus sp. B-H-3]|uniref:hypothetical protein n=1 Tax=Peribacillus sp. B-H-3 TaxID=3400420 RepID=UPI003B0224A5
MLGVFSLGPYGRIEYMKYQTLIEGLLLQSELTEMTAGVQSLYSAKGICEP